MKLIIFIDEPKKEVINFLRNRKLYTDSEIFNSCLIEGKFSYSLTTNAFSDMHILSSTTLSGIMTTMVISNKKSQYFVEDLTNVEDGMDGVVYPIDQKTVLRNLHYFLMDQSLIPIEINTIVNDMPDVRYFKKYRLRVTHDFMKHPIWDSIKKNARADDEGYPESLYNVAYSAQNDENIIKERLHKFVWKEVNRIEIEKRAKGISLENIPKKAFVPIVLEMTHGLEDATKELIGELWDIISTKANRKTIKNSLKG